MYTSICVRNDRIDSRFRDAALLKCFRRLKGLNGVVEIVVDPRSCIVPNVM